MAGHLDFLFQRRSERRRKSKKAVFFLFSSPRASRFERTAAFPPSLSYKAPVMNATTKRCCGFCGLPPFECYFTEVIPPNNFCWLSRFPPPRLYVFIFQANLIGSPSESFQTFQWYPFGFSVTTDPPFCSPKNQVIPPKILLSHPQRDR